MFEKQGMWASDGLQLSKWGTEEVQVGRRVRCDREGLGDVATVGDCREKPLQLSHRIVQGLFEKVMLPIPCSKSCVPLGVTAPAASLRYLYSNAHSMGNKQGELEIVYSHRAIISLQSRSHCGTVCVSAMLSWRTISFLGKTGNVEELSFMRGNN